MVPILALVLLAAAPADPFEADLRAVLQKFGGDAEAVPQEFKDNVRRFRDQLAQRKDLPEILARKDRYWPVIARALAAKSLPVEFGFVAMAESHFDPAARGEISAGMWQFIAPTARKFGLRVDDSADERLDADKASAAAAAYLAALVAEFGPESFMLALTSYNAGEGSVRRGLEQVTRGKGVLRNAAHDYFELYPRLGDEAREYVPKVIAAALVGGKARAP